MEKIASVVAITSTGLLAGALWISAAAHLWPIR
jgi:hypothetical protein